MWQEAQSAFSTYHRMRANRTSWAGTSQKGKPIAFFSRNMNSAQQNYTTTEKELLSKVETIKEFLNILLGHQITVYTDHKNLTYKKF